MAVKRRRVLGKSTSVPSTVGGWNARDATSAMKDTDAVTLTNMFPTPTDVMLRRGYSNHVTGLPSEVETLMSYSSGTADKLFAASGTSIYDVTSSGTVGSAVLSSLTNARWEHVNLSTSGGSFLMMVNGHDKLRSYNGSAWGKDGDGVGFDITGVDTATCSNINLFANRVWLVQKNSLKAWYLPVSSKAGAASSIDMGPIARFGGHLVAMETWTIDAGNGMDDHAVFITSNGEVIVYKGTDPSSAETWFLVGVWHIGSPLGTRCTLKWGGDCLLLTHDGLVPMTMALQSANSSSSTNGGGTFAITDKISSALGESVTLYSSNFGWEMIYFASANMLILNVPVTVTGTNERVQQQYVMNTLSKAWCNWTGIKANCWTIFQNNLYFGGNTVVGRGWYTNADNGANITGSVKQAFSYFKLKGVNKRWTMIRPILKCAGDPGIATGMNTDYDDVDDLGLPTFAAQSVSTWDSSVWDDAVWGSGSDIIDQWRGVTAEGFAGAFRMKIIARNIGDVRWLSTDFVFEQGSVL